MESASFLAVTLQLSGTQLTVCPHHSPSLAVFPPPGAGRVMPAPLGLSEISEVSPVRRKLTLMWNPTIATGHGKPRAGVVWEGAVVPTP